MPLSASVASSDALCTGMLGSSATSGIPEFQTLLLQGEGLGKSGSPGGAGTPTLPSVVTFMGSAAVQGGTGARVMAPQQLERWCLRSYCHCCPLTCGLRHCYSQDAGVLCTACLLLLGSLGLWTQQSWPEISDCQHYFHWSSGSALSTCSSQTTFRCIDMGNSPVSLCARHRLLFCTMDVL